MNDPFLVLSFFFIFISFSPSSSFYLFSENAKRKRKRENACLEQPLPLLFLAPFLFSLFLFNDLKVGGTNATRICAPVNCSSCSTAST